MKKVYFLYTVIYCLFFTGLSTAQNNTIHDLIEEAFKKQIVFQKVDIFQQNLQRSHQFLELQPFAVMDLQQEELQQLVQNAPEAIELDLPLDQKGNLSTVQVVRVDLFADGAQVRTASGDSQPAASLGVHFRGEVKGQEGSLVALSFFENEVAGLISVHESEPITLAKAKNSSTHLIFKARERSEEEAFECHTRDKVEAYPEEMLRYSKRRSADNCVNIYLEVENDIYTYFNSSATTAAQYVSMVANQSFILYQNIGVTLKVSEVFVWDKKDPYTSSVSKRLADFGNTRKTFNGDIAHLLTFQTNGGISWIGGLCSHDNRYKMSVSGLSTFFLDVPTYSWSVEVFAHETGHMLGSQHTHACAWNGNGTAIDGCYPTEGSCARPESPSGGGTIMSYCHLTGVGIDFSKGFHAQPATVIKNTIAAASCLDACEEENNDVVDNGGGEDSGGGEEEEGGNDPVDDGKDDDSEEEYKPNPIDIKSGLYTIQNIHSDHYIAIEGDSKKRGKDIEVDSIENKFIEWDVQEMSEGIFYLANKGSKRVIDVARRDTSDNADILQWTFNAQPNQMFAIVSLDTNVYTVAALHSGKCLEESDTFGVAREDLVQSKCDSADWQLWRFVPVDQGNSFATAAGLVEKSELSVYPNPAVSTASVEISGLEKESQLIVVNVAGQKVMEKTLKAGEGVVDLNVSDFLTGFYKVLHFYDGVLLSAASLVKQ